MNTLQTPSTPTLSPAPAGVAHALAHAERLLSEEKRRPSSESRDSNRQQAQIYAHQALQQAPNSLDALNLLARIALEQQQLKRAEGYLQTALALDPGNPHLLFTRGHLELARYQYEGAEASFREAIDAKDNFFRAFTSLAYTILAQGRTLEAFGLYRQLFRQDPQDPHTRSKLFECMAGLQADYDNPGLAADLVHYLSLRKVDHQQLQAMTASLLSHRYCLNDSDAPPIELKQLAADPLLTKALRQICFSQPALEALVSGVRGALLNETLAAGTLDPAFVSLTLSLALQSWNNEYVLEAGDTETAQVAALRKLIDQACESTANTAQLLGAIEAPLLLIAMYQPCDTLAAADRLAAIPLSRWPGYLQPLIETTLLGPRRERRRARAIPSLGESKNRISRAVRSQYEENPYPRWLSLGYHTDTHYAQALQQELRGFIAPQFLFEPKLRILVAGCGTGRHALHVARYFYNAQVTAIDLSRRSLAYARQKCDEYGLDNIHFYQADILELGDWQERFHIIESSGVLHHMQNPMQGWQILRNLLTPQGLMKVGLYSERARQEVRLCQRIIEEEGIPSEPDAIRAFRQRILTGDLKEDCQAIARSPDFYNLSGCRDLLFHVQEHGYTPLELQASLDQLELKFLGFVRTAGGVKEQYTRAFKDDWRQTRLENWETFEQENPDTFAGMYQFYCQKG